MYYRSNCSHDYIIHISSKQLSECQPNNIVSRRPLQPHLSDHCLQSNAETRYQVGSHQKIINHVFMSNFEIRTKPASFARFRCWMRKSTYFMNFSDHYDYRNLADAIKLGGFQSLTWQGILQNNFIMGLLQDFDVRG